MKKNISILSVLVIMVLVISMLTACGGTEPAADESASGDAAAETATVILVDQDETEYTYEVPAGMNLRDSLKEAGLIDDANYSNMFVETIDGHTALMADGVLWLMCDQDKNQINGFYEEKMVEPGETIYLIYTVAPNFDD